MVLAPFMMITTALTMMFIDTMITQKSGIGFYLFLIHLSRSLPITIPNYQTVNTEDEQVYFMSS